MWGIGIGEHYQRKRGMFIETFYLLLSGRSNALIDPQTIAMVRVGDIKLVSLSLNQR
jgi:hypothetical protein